MNAARSKSKGPTRTVKAPRNDNLSGEAAALSPSQLASIAQARVLVVGDVMLDRYWFGEVERISPEAPVPVVKINKIEERPGGAANVARNAAALGARVSLLSVTGRDEAGTRLRRLLKNDRI